MKKILDLKHTPYDSKVNAKAGGGGCSCNGGGSCGGSGCGCGGGR